MKKIVSLSFIMILLMIACGQIACAGGIAGRAAHKGEVIKGVLIYAYTEFGDDGLGSNFFKISEPTKVDGTYKFELPAGKYYFVARKTGGGIDMKPDDFYCYYSGSPIEVSDSSYKNVGFNLIKIPSIAETKLGSTSGVEGTIVFEDKLLEKVYLFAYKSAQSDFKGPADYVSPSVNGKFKLRLPEGKYYLLARKRKQGGMYGPMEKDDIFNYYYKNPVEVKSDTLVQVEIECISRLDMLEEPIGEVNLRGITVNIKDKDGKPIDGLYLLVYNEAEMKGRPHYISERSDANGKIFLEINKAGKYYILVRSKLGGPAVEGEYYSKYTANLDSSVALTEEKMHETLDFKVEKFKPIN